MNDAATQPASVVLLDAAAAVARAVAHSVEIGRSPEYLTPCAEAATGLARAALELEELGL